MNMDLKFLVHEICKTIPPKEQIKREVEYIMQTRGVSLEDVKDALDLEYFPEDALILADALDDTDLASKTARIVLDSDRDWWTDRYIEIANRYAGGQK